MSSTSFQSPLKHPNERCTSCGLWKRKLASCKHCARSPNRHQVAAAKSAQIIPQPLAKARSASVTMHPNERCHQCGLWKTKFQECTHCAGRANRMQATVAQMLQAGMLPDAKPFETSPLLLHEKERCHSCGLWSAFSAPNSYHAAPPHGCVFHALCTNHRLTTRACLLACACVERKTVACGFCLVRPNRMQAAVAALKRPSSSLGLLRQMLEPGDSSFALKMTSPPVAPSEAAKVTATPIVGVVHHTWIHPPSPKPYHPKQRCHSCGLWADKVKGCEHCATRCPNREQARQALIKANSFVIPRGPLGSMPVYGNTPF